MKNVASRIKHSSSFMSYMGGVPLLLPFMGDGGSHCLLNQLKMGRGVRVCRCARVKMSQVKALITCRLDCVERGVPLLLPFMGDGGSHCLWNQLQMGRGCRVCH